VRRSYRLFLMVFSIAAITAAVVYATRMGDRLSTDLNWSPGMTLTPGITPQITAWPFFNPAIKDTPTPEAVPQDPAGKKERVDYKEWDFTLANLSGGTTRLSALDDKLVLVNFWATWCPACVAEMPDLIKANKTLKDKGLGRVLCVNVKEKEQTVRKNVDARGWEGIDILLDPDGRVAQKYKVSAIPATFVFYKGKLIRTWNSAVGLDRINELIEEVSKGKFE